MFKDKEGRKITSRNPMDIVATYIMPTRNGASNHFSDTINLENCEKYIAAKRASGLKGFGMMHIIMAAYVRTCSQKPGINRFLRGQQLYARNGVEICLTIKKELKLDAEETVVKVMALPTDTVDDIYNKLSKLVLEVKGASSDKTSMDYVALVLSKFPRLILKFGVWILRVLDYFGLLPRSLTSVSPFHGSMFLTNLGSLGIPPVYHHLYDFGNLPVFISMGATHKKLVKDKITENVVEKRYMDYTVVCDERICDGHYYANAFKSMKSIFRHPEILDTPPQKVVEDIV